MPESLMDAAIARLARGDNLDGQTMAGAMREMMTGAAGAEQARAFLVALRDKGETVTEIAAAARTLMQFAVPVSVAAENLVDTCGTGGDGAGTFNISTGAALAAAGAGATVAKHGNRSVSSQSGSADVLEAAGVRLELGAEQAAECIRQTGIGFLFAPCFHPAMKQVAPVRKAIGTRTLFNLLGPLLNPAAAPCRVIGVFDARWLEPMAETAAATGVRRVMTVHSEDGLDEISTAAPTQVFEQTENGGGRRTLTPADFNCDSAPAGALRVSSPEDSLKMLRAVLAGEPGAAADAVAVNAGAALYIAGLAGGLREGADMARRALRDGRGAAKLDALVKASNRRARPTDG